MNVVALKLISGEEVIAELVEDLGDKIVAKNVVAVLLQKAEKGNVIGFYPFMPYLAKNSTITFSMANIVVKEEVGEELKNEYSELFGGIVTPTKQIIT